MTTRTPLAPSVAARRWRVLGLAARRVLTAAALHEGELSDALLAALATEPEAIDAVVDGGWLAEGSDGRWSLRTDSASVRALAPWSLRRSAHLALATWHTRQTNGAARAAAHFESGGQPDESGRWWLLAARGHSRRQQHRAAARCFVEAIRLMPDGMDEQELVSAVDDFGICAGMQREVNDAVELLQRWRERPGWQRKDAFQGAAARVLAGLFARTARHVESAAAHRTSAAHYERAGLESAAAAGWLAAATTLVFALHLNAACESSRRAIELAGPLGRSDLVSQSFTILGLAQGMLGETEAGRVSLESALGEALGAGLTTQAADAYRVLGNVSEYASCYRDEQAAFNRALSYCRRHDEDHISDLCLGCYSYSLFRSGNWQRSLALARRIVGSTTASVVSRCVADGVLGLLLAHRGEVRPALARLRACQRTARQTGIMGMEFFAWWGLALACEGSGDASRAMEAYSTLLELWKGTEDRHDAVPGLAGAVSFFVRRGEESQAAEYAAALQRIAVLNPNPEMVGAAAQAAGELDLLAGRYEEAVARFSEAQRSFEQRDLPVELVRVRLRLGMALDALGNTKQAREVWREARRRAGRLGARPLAAEAAALERRPSPENAGSPEPAAAADVLSPRQREVAQHLSSGCTNKEIASHLGLSVRTVDMHVAHLLARLSCRTRTEAVAKLTLLAFRTEPPGRAVSPVGVSDQ